MSVRRKVEKVGNMGNSNNPIFPISPRIIDAVRDQEGGLHICFGSDDENCVWFKVSDLVDQPTKVFSRLSAKGLGGLSAAKKEELKTLVERHSTFRSGLVAHHPGWLQGHFVFGDGRVISPGTKTSEVIVNFKGNPKFIPIGTLAQWQADYGIVKDQIVCLFAAAVGVTGMIKPFVPADYTNPIVEFVGPAQCGKSTIGTMVASILAGNPDGSCGGGESWSTTLFALIERAKMYRHQTLFLDEANLACNSSGSVGDFFKNAIFSLAEGYDRARFGDDDVSKHLDAVLVSTSNIPMRELIKGEPKLIEAINSRAITVPISGEFGVFDRVPDGFASSREAIEAMRAAANRNYGVAGAFFAKELVKRFERKPRALKTFILSILDLYLIMSASLGSSPRLQKQFAMIAAAGFAAQILRVFPLTWGSIFGAVLAVHERVAKWEKANRPLTDIERIQRFVKETKADRMSLKECSWSNSKAKFDNSAGCIVTHENRRCLFISPKYLKQAFHDHLDLMRSLRANGHAKTESQNKFSNKPPKTFAHLGRIYWIYLPR